MHTQTHIIHTYYFTLTHFLYTHTHITHTYTFPLPTHSNTLTNTCSHTFPTHILHTHSHISYTNTHTRVCVCSTYRLSWSKITISWHIYQSAPHSFFLPAYGTHPDNIWRG